MTDSIEPLQAMHERFCELAGIDKNDLRFSKHWVRYFYELNREGFSITEMELVVRYVQMKNKKASEPHFRRAILPSRILGDMERFCEDLAEAKRLAALRTSPREQVLREFRRCSTDRLPDNTTHTAREALLKAITQDPMTL
jgi:hypothetical protein